jgi:hypothetical protein
MKLFVIMATAVLLLAGCKSLQQRQIRKLDDLVLQQPAEFARLSNILNPCFSGKAKSDTVITQGKGDTTTVTRYIQGEPGKNDTVFINKKIVVPYKYSIHDTVPDTRGLAACNIIARAAADSLLITKTKLSLVQSQTQKTKGDLVKWIIGLSLLLAAIIGFSIYKFFSGGFIKKLI